jgi:DNA-binding transcriptional regulator YiaG
MLAVVNQSRIEIRAKRIPAKLMNFIRLEYPNVVVKKNDNSEDVDFTELEWFKKTRAAMTPAENLKLLRKERQLSKKELAEILDTAEENLYW